MERGMRVAVEFFGKLESNHHIMSTDITNQADFLSLGEVAANFGWTLRFVERLAATDQLPGVRVEGQWWFRREELVDWLDRKVQTLEPARIADLEHKLESELQTAARGVHLANRLPVDAIGLDVRVNGKTDVLRELVDLAEKTGQLLDRAPLYASLVEREALCSTALPGGVAICHPRRPVPHLVRRTLLAFLRTDEPVAFGAEDGSPTQVFFLIAAVDDRAHLYALARLSRVLRGSTPEMLRLASTAADIAAVVQQRESEIDVAVANVT
jgi:nitrogen PTS system EIIA component